MFHDICVVSNNAPATAVITNKVKDLTLIFLIGFFNTSIFFQEISSARILPSTFSNSKGDPVLRGWTLSSEILKAYNLTEQSSQPGSEPPSVKADVYVWH